MRLVFIFKEGDAVLLPPRLEDLSKTADVSFCKCLCPM